MGANISKSHAGRKNLGVSWFFFNLLAASMLLVVVARNGLLFLMSWELMSLASFFLVMLDDEQESVRRAGWIYLVAMHLGTAFLRGAVPAVGPATPGRWTSSGSPPRSTRRGLLFLLALIGFGTKAGFIPMHVWLPEAHPAAPSHVSAVMSGVMIKTGIYGLLRILTLLGPPPAWWGWTLLAIGVVSGVLGVLYALAQHDLKRLLAYHSVENIGIIALGLGVGVLGNQLSAIPTWRPWDFTGGLLHVVNHAVFKSLLFLGAGSVLHATGTGETRSAGRTAQAHAGHRGNVPGRRGGHLRAAAAERLCQRVPHLPRRPWRGSAAEARSARLAVDGRLGRRRAGADRRAWPPPASPRPSASCFSASRAATKRPRPTKPARRCAGR